MIKKEFVKLYAEKEGIYNNEAQRRIEVMLDLLKGQFQKNEEVIFRGFGSFKVKETTRTTGVNPRTGKAIKIKPKKYVKFKVSQEIFSK